MYIGCNILVGCIKVKALSGKNNIANIVLHKKTPCPQIRTFSGIIMDKCTDSPLSNVDISIRCGAFSCSKITDCHGHFKFSLPYQCKEISISIAKHGFIKRYIGSYPITKECGNYFYLFRK